MRGPWPLEDASDLLVANQQDTKAKVPWLGEEYRGLWSPWWGKEAAVTTCRSLGGQKDHGGIRSSKFQTMMMVTDTEKN